MKNLKYFYLFCMCEAVDKNYYNNLNEKLSSLNLDGINIQIKNGVIIGESIYGQHEEEKYLNEFKENGIYIKKIN